VLQRRGVREHTSPCECRRTEGLYPSRWVSTCQREGLSTRRRECRLVVALDESQVSRPVVRRRSDTAVHPASSFSLESELVARDVTSTILEVGRASFHDVIERPPALDEVRREATGMTPGP
jgi:hypothetical protein